MRSNVLIFLFIVLLVSNLNTLYIVLAPKDFLLFFFIKAGSSSFDTEIPLTHVELIFMAGVMSRVRFIDNLPFNPYGGHQ